MEGLNILIYINYFWKSCWWLSDYKKPFILITDTSDFATGAVLKQEDTLGWSYPVAYYSKSLQPVECNYKIHNKELLAII
jgi:hypothetical protein